MNQMTPKPIPPTGDSHYGGYGFTVSGAPLRASVLSSAQFGGSISWANRITGPEAPTTPLVVQ